MNQSLKQLVEQKLAPASVIGSQTIQSLWGGYGELVRVQLHGAEPPSVVVKQIQYPSAPSHPRGWNTQASHQRKVRSYQVEGLWYQQFSSQCKARVPEGLSYEPGENSALMIMEDLAQAGFDTVLTEANALVIQRVLSWLAQFHAQYMSQGSNPAEQTGLWRKGTYWHLDTRPDELAVMEDERFKSMAQAIDDTLTNTTYQTIVHGDAKLANFCFSDDLAGVAAVDFQYVGGGCGMKDVALFLSSVLAADELDDTVEDYLEHYFAELERFLAQYRSEIDAREVKLQWRPLYEVAWADFLRFVKGWSPNHWKINEYSVRVSEVGLKWVENNTGK